MLNTKEVHSDALEADYTMLNPEIVRHPVHEDVIRKDLTRQLGSLTTEIMEELGSGFDQYWGFDTENWKEACVFENMMRIIARTSNRVIVGLPLCECRGCCTNTDRIIADSYIGRNEDFLTNMASFSQDIPISGQCIKLFPKILKPLVGPIITLPNRYHHYKCAKYTVPLVKQRFADMERKRQDPDYKYEEPNDFLTWQIRDALKRGEPTEMTPEMISHRVLVVNFAAIHTSTFTVTNTLIDLISSPPEKGYLAGIREEAQRVLEEGNGVWTKAGLAKMIRVDSAIRESMRLSGFSSQGLVRKVVGNEGITLEDGLHLNKGINIGLSAYSIHHDETIYDDAMAYDAFRFSRAREAFAESQGIPTDDLMTAEKPMPNGAATNKGDNLTEVLKHKNLSMVSTSETFLPFGHGRHACPGRFFAANELKLLIAYMVLNYEIKPLAVRPKNIWLADTVLPPMKATIQVRRRKAEDTG